jgi:hypothetical protein
MLVNPHVESTGSHWPNSQQLKEHLSFPLALALQPFANEHPSSLIAADFIGDHRCQSCKAFINQLCFIRSERKQGLKKMSTIARSAAAPTPCRSPSISAESNLTLPPTE